MRFRIVFVIAAIGSLLGCVGGEESASDATSATFNSIGAQVVEFSVPDMMCAEGCGEKTKSILLEQPGAKEVLVDFESKTVSVATADTFDVDAAIAALVDHGFDHSTVKKAATPAPGR